MTVELRPSEMIDALVAAYHAGTVPFIHGMPGIGKSQVVYQSGQILSKTFKGFDIIEKRTCYMEPTDAVGLPNFVKDKYGAAQYTDYMPMKWLAELDPDGRGWIFLDEFSQALLATQNAWSQPILMHEINGMALPKGWRFVMASNDKSHKAGITEMASHMKSRVQHFNMVTSLDEFCEHGTKKGFDPSVISFLRFRQQFLMDFQPDNQTYPCPRTWEMASNVAKSLGTKGSPLVLKASIAGCVGETAATDYIAFLEIWKTIPKMEEILKDPEGTSIPVQLGVRRATASCIATAMTAENIDTLARYIKRMPGELIAACLEAAKKANPEITKHKTFAAMEKLKKE